MEGDWKMFEPKSKNYFLYILVSVEGLINEELARFDYYLTW